MSGAAVPDRLERLFRKYLEPLGYGQADSRGPVDRDGGPIPWITYPAFHMLQRLVWPEHRVFEFGCGHSSLWWSSKVTEVVSVDHDLAWLGTIRARAWPRQTLIHRPIHAPPGPVPPELAADVQALIDGQWSSGQAGFDIMHGHNCADFLGYATSLLQWPRGTFDWIVVDGMARP